MLCSQAPEFAQQYRQRLGGAVDELTILVNNFDNDAAKLDLTRQQALYQLATADKAFFHARAVSMQTTFNRYEALSKQLNAFNSLEPILRPVALLSTYDETVINGAWSNFEPAIPLTTYGAMWASIGAVFGWLFARLLAWPFSIIKKSPKKRISRHHRQPPSI